MEQVIPKPPIKKAWPLMTPAERLAIWEEARLAWTHDASGCDRAYRTGPGRGGSRVATTCAVARVHARHQHHHLLFQR